jgi:hypothetical protein
VPVTAKAVKPARAVIPAKAGIPAGEGRRRVSPAGAPAFGFASKYHFNGVPPGATILPRGSRASPLAPFLLLAGCAAAQSAAAVQPQAPGFWLGLWHGFIFPVAWIVSLFVPDVAVYAVPNNGGWYDFGYFLGIVVFGVGARKSAIEIRGARRSHVHMTTTVHHEERL